MFLCASSLSAAGDIIADALAASVLTVGAINCVPCRSRWEHGVGSHASETAILCVSAECNLDMSVTRMPEVDELLRLA